MNKIIKKIQSIYYYIKNIKIKNLLYKLIKEINLFINFWFKVYIGFIEFIIIIYIPITEILLPYIYDYIYKSYLFSYKLCIFEYIIYTDKDFLINKNPYLKELNDDEIMYYFILIVLFYFFIYNLKYIYIY